ncbi:MULTISPECIES: YybH family protein [Shewanella]|uniref:YybH family protein n=1 Tax=Shewanella TaxID=22 RepID=UPI001F424528|nr:nuclear transport factor 2 family protein [Shewanella psychromarinicola]MCL1080730.1 nuclear transport factor 2 family protein [Shewanella psychromarinicola]
MKKILTLLNAPWSSLLLLAVGLSGITLNVYAAESIPHQTLNANFTKLTQAFEQLDLTAIEQIYTDDAVYISETQDRGIISGKENILDLYSRFFNKIKTKHAKLEVDFRVLVRYSEPNSATYIGYYLVRFHPGKESGEPISEFAGKFVTVFTKDSKQQWKISVDSNTHAAPHFYYDAKPVPNLYYGRQFIAAAAK